MVTVIQRWTRNAHSSLVWMVLKRKNRFDVLCGVKHRRQGERGKLNKTRVEAGGQQKQETGEFNGEDCKLPIASLNLPLCHWAAWDWSCFIYTFKEKVTRMTKVLEDIQGWEIVGLHLDVVGICDCIYVMDCSECSKTRMVQRSPEECEPIALVLSPSDRYFFFKK